MDFLPEHISRMMAALPIKNDRRRALMPCILREWGREYLDQHLTLKNRAAMRKESKRFNEIAKRADALASRLFDLGRIQRYALGHQLSELETRLERGGKRDLMPDEQLEFAEHFDAEPARLERMATAARRLGRWTPMRVQHDSYVRHRVLMDLAAMFEYATGKPAKRRVRGEDHPEHGKDYGPFFTYCACRMDDHLPVIRRPQLEPQALGKVSRPFAYF